MGEIIDRTGEIKYNNQGLKMWIEKYINYRCINVEFENGYVFKNNNYDNFKKGQIKNPYYPEIFGIGYLGEGKYKSKINKKQEISYNYWFNMLKRCYNKKVQEKQKTYIECTVCEEWHNFQNFAEWFHNNYYEIEGETMCLDKDILVKGNKIYSPNTCIFVPQKINCLFVKSDGTRGELPIGVSKCKGNRIKKYIAICSINNKTKNLGYYATPEEAFDVYKQFKELYIKEIANKYKDKIPEELYNAMYNWKIDIDD